MMAQPVALYSASDGRVISLITAPSARSDGVFDAGEGGGADRIVALMEVADDADAFAAHALGEARVEIGHRAIGAAGVCRVMAGHGLQQQGDIFHRPGHGAGMVEGLGEGQDAGAWAEPIGGLDAGNAAKGCGAADGAARVRAGAAHDDAGGNGRAGAGAGAGGEACGVPRVAGGRPGEVEAGAAKGEFMGGEFAE